MAIIVIGSMYFCLCSVTSQEKDTDLVMFLTDIHWKLVKNKWKDIENGTILSQQLFLRTISKYVKKYDD